MESEAHERTIQGRGYLIGEFICPASSQRWRTENQIRGGPLFVFPSVPVEIAYEGRDAVLADPNQVLFYNDAQRYRRKLLDHRGDRCIFIRLDARDVADVLRDAGLRAGDDPARPFNFNRTSGRPETYLRHIAIARYVFHAKIRDDLFVLESLLMMLRDTAANIHPRTTTRDPKRSRRGVEAVRAAQVVLNRRFHENRSLGELGEEVELSPFHLARLFRAHLGSTVHDYRERLRLLRGLSRLLEGETLIDVAIDVGYSSHSHFTQAFRRRFRRSPSEVRRLLGCSDRDLRALAAIMR